MANDPATTETIVATTKQEVAQQESQQPEQQQKQQEQQQQQQNLKQSEEQQEEASKRKNFKNLTISVHDHPQQRGPTTSSNNSMKCQCAHYFNTEMTADPSLSTENVPSTVKSISSDSCYTYGTHYPNRIFIGHLPGKANATDLADFFRAYGTVLEGKVVLDSFGRSRRFGFVTFATHEDVQNVLSQGPIFFKGKKINVGPAVKRMFGAEFSPPSSPSPDSSTVSCASDDESGGETIITVPPVNETKDPSTPSTPKSGNVWLKISSKPKMTPKKTVEHASVVPQQFTYPTYQHKQQQQPHQHQQHQHQQHQHQQRPVQQHFNNMVQHYHRSHRPQHRPQQQQQQQQQQYYYVTVPCNQAYAYHQGGYYTQSPIYYGESGQAMVMSPHWNMQQQQMYLPGSLSVA